MKNPSKILSVLLASAVFLTACGGDKPAEPAPKAEPKAEVKSEPATTQAKPSEPKADEPQTDDKADTSKTETPQNDKADAPAEPAKDTAKDAPKDEPKKEEPKSEVKALSLEEGKARYEKTCKICHEQGLLNAPKLTDKAGWEKRLAKGIDTLHTHSAKGFGKMPAQVTDEVSEAEVYAAVDYMVSQVK